MYPGEYPVYKQCDWLITAPYGYHVTLSFSHLAVEENSNCGYDSLKVRCDNVCRTNALRKLAHAINRDF